MTNKIELKNKLYQKCIEAVMARHETIGKSIEDIHQALQSETKSSAGDKHETGRAMLQLEREKAGARLAEVELLIKTLDQIEVNSLCTVVEPGSVVITNQMTYFIAVSAGLLAIDSLEVYAISAETPIGRLLMNKSKGDEVDFRGQTIRIMDLF